MKRWLASIALLLCACTITPVTHFELEAKLINDANRLLTVEGRSNLPEGSPLEVGVFEGERRLILEQARVEEGRFYALVDLTPLNGQTPYRVEVAFDPLLAEAEVTDLTGARGEAMNGEQVEYKNGRYRLVDEFALTLSGSGMSLAYHEDPAVLVKQLEKLCSERPDDVEYQLQLALALLRWSEGERRPGTRADRILHRVIESVPNSTQAETAKMWIGRLEAEEQARRAEAELNEQIAGGGLFTRRRRVVPGQSLGAIRLGMPYRALGRRFKVKRRPRFDSDEEVITVEFKDFKGVSVGVDSATRKIVWASTTDPFFKLDGGYGAGSVIQEVPGLRTPKFGPFGYDDEGFEVAYGVVSRPGIEFTIARKKDPVTKFPLDVVDEIRILPMSD